MPKKRSLEQIKKLEYLKMSELGDLLNIRYSTIKYYSELNLLPFIQRGERLAKYYPVKEARERIKKILELKEKRLSMEEIVKKLLK